METHGWSTVIGMLGKNVRNEHATRAKSVTRSQVPNPDMIGYGKGSETKREQVAYEGLINQMRLKI